MLLLAFSIPPLCVQAGQGTVPCRLAAVPGLHKVKGEVQEGRPRPGKLHFPLGDPKVRPETLKGFPL